MKKIEVTCIECGKIFERNQNEVNRSKKLGRKFFCSLRCSCKFTDRERLERGEILGKPFEKNHKLGYKKQKNELTKFRPIFKRVKNRKDKKEIKLTIEDIKEMWESQCGICPYTKIKLELPDWDKKKTFNTASIDRIDTSKGYSKENCHIVSIMANFAKNDFTHDDMIKFCNEIRNN